MAITYKHNYFQGVKYMLHFSSTNKLIRLSLEDLKEYSAPTFYTNCKTQ